MENGREGFNLFLVVNLEFPSMLNKVAVNFSLDDVANDTSE